MIPLQHIHLLAAPIRTLAEITTPGVADAISRSAGLPTDIAIGPPLFVPYGLQVKWAAAAARRLGERHIGAVLAARIGYGGLSFYGDYVLEASHFYGALQRARKALRLILSSSVFTTSIVGDHLVLSYHSGVEDEDGSNHLDEAMPLVLLDFVRSFAGADWKPVWIELPARHGPVDAFLEEIYGGIPLHSGSAPAIAMALTDLAIRNPAPPSARTQLVYDDLPALAGVTAPATFTELVVHMLRLQLRSGDPSAEAVAERLAVGVRTLQRKLVVEGVVFRDLRLEETLRRAAALLSESELSISDIAAALGYEEPNSFRRAFKERFGRTPGQFRSPSR